MAVLKQKVDAVLMFFKAGVCLNFAGSFNWLLQAFKGLGKSFIATFLICGRFGGDGGWP